MKRLRVVFVAVAVVLLVPLALLIEKALASAEVERSARHRAVAGRIVDEMERDLGTWLRREEDRPYSHYRYFFVPEEPTAQLIINLTPSPLAQAPAEPFVVGYFQVDPDGTVTSPLVPRNTGLARSATGWQPSAENDATVARVKAAVADLWAAPASLDDPLEDSREAPRQMAGSTVELTKKGRPSKELKKQKRLPQEAEEDDTLRVLEQLNRAARERQQRGAKVESSQAPNVYNFSTEDNQLQRVDDGRRWEADRDAAEREDLLSTSAAAVRADIEETLQTEASASIEVRQEPMIGRRGQNGNLVLYRTVLIGDSAYRQGLVLDVPALVDWVAERVLDDELRSRARIGGSTDKLGRSTAAYVYRHRFAEPFATVSSVIALEALPELPGTTYTYALALLLGVAAPLGLFALYRMVAVAVGYAERRSNFVSSVTHELKTPLTAIRMYGEMLRDGLVLSEAKRQTYYEIMTAESERLTRLVNNVLELSRLENRNRSMKLEVGDLGPVLEEVLAVLLPHAEKEGFELRLDLDPDLPQVRFDRDALVQVLFYLIDNAIKYSRRAADKEIAIRCSRQGEGVMVAVRDHGPGVAQPHLKKIFAPFYRGESELTRTAKGTGIGLALVRGLVERMGGAVSGRNGADGGFEVSVILSPS